MIRILVDEPKRLTNLKKHRIDLNDAAVFDWTAAAVFDAKAGRGLAIGRLHDSLVTIIFRKLGTEAIAIISIRPASRKEQRSYDEKHKLD